MKKVVTAMIFSLVLISSGAYAQGLGGNQQGPLALGVGIDYSVAFGEWGQDGYDDFRMAMSSRIGFLVDVGYRPLQFMAFGAETGFRFMYYEWDDPYSEAGAYSIFLDFPVRGYLRFGKGIFFVQAFGGYYFSTGNNYLAGWEAGVKASVIGITLEVSHVWGDVGNTWEGDWVQPNYWRMSIGYRFNLM